MVLCNIEDQSYEEIAATLGVKRGTVRSRIHRGRSHLRKALRHRSPQLRVGEAPDALDATDVRDVADVTRGGFDDAPVLAAVPAAAPAVVPGGLPAARSGEAEPRDQ